MTGNLSGRVALVTGATRGAGRGIAVELGAAGATVYCTGRTTRTQRSPLDRPETIEETAELVSAAGGRGIAVQVDHLQTEQVASLIRQIDIEQHGQLDILVNDIWGGQPLADWGPPFWEHDLTKAMTMLHNAVDTHIITLHQAAPLMIKHRERCGLIVEITDGWGDGTGFQDHLFYDLSKKSTMRLAVACAAEMRPYNVTAVSVSPGWLRSEEMLEGNGVTEENWQERYWRNPDNPRWLASESPRYIGRAVAALAADPHVASRHGDFLTAAGLARSYRFTDLNGTRPGYGRYSVDYLDARPPVRAEYNLD